MPGGSGIRLRLALLAGDLALGLLLGGGCCSLVRHCDEAVPEGSVEHMFRIPSLMAGESFDRGKLTGVDLERFGYGVMSGLE